MDEGYRRIVKLGKSDYLGHQIKVNWDKDIRTLWKFSPGSYIHRYLTIDLKLYTDDSVVNPKDDIVIIGFDQKFNKRLAKLLDTGIRFIIESLAENRFFQFEEFLPYANNGIALVAGTPYNLNWPINKTHFVPMSYWHIEYFRSLSFSRPKLDFRRNNVKYDFLMPVNKDRYYKNKFVELIRPNLNRGMYSIGWENIFLPDDDECLHAEDDYRWFQHYNPKWYNETFYSMVVETFQDCSIFPTEKTFKPIKFGHPFMIYGTEGMLQTLRNYGFSTFPKLFDESYDSEVDPIKRAELIVEQVVKFNRSIMNIDAKAEIDNAIFNNFHLFYNEERVLNDIRKEIKIPIERFIYER